MKLSNHLKFAACAAASIMLVGCAGTRYSRSTGQYIDDKATVSRVNGALNDDSLLEAADIKVASYRGHVHLTGFVDQPVQKERASLITRNVKGVDWFKNDIIVKSAMPDAREEINEAAGASNQQQGQQQNQQESQSQFQQQQQQPQSQMSPQESGWQRGSLTVYDPAAKMTAQPAPVVRGSSRASKSSTEQRGADKLISNEPAGSNNDLAQRVSAQLQSDNSAAAQNVRVENSGNGKITLRGTVGSATEKSSIESKAKSVPGVSDVDNELEIQNQ